MSLIYQRKYKFARKRGLKISHDNAVMKKSEKSNNQKFIGEMLMNNRISGFIVAGNVSQNVKFLIFIQRSEL